MAGFLERISSAARGERRDNQTTSLSMYDWAKMFRPGAVVNYNGRAYQAYNLGAYGAANTAFYEKNPIVFACESKRINVFCEAVFKFQRFENSRPSDLFGGKGLTILEEPWPGASQRDLLSVAELDVATAGNSYWILHEGYLQRLDPSKVRVVTEATEDEATGVRIGERLLGYVYKEPGLDPVYYDPTEIAHYKPVPGCSPFIGQSWLAACFADIDSDDAMTEHKRTTMRNGANLRTIVSLDESISADEFKQFVELFRELHEGPENSGRTLFLGGGANVSAYQQSFNDLSLKETQGATETRIAACAGVPAVIVGLSEGMQGSSLNAGNYGAAKRSFVDSTMRPLWGAFAQAFRWLVPVPAGARLWYDDRDIPFLREDLKDQAEIMQMDASSMRQLIDAGFEPDAVVDAFTARDLKRLMGKHTNLYSVQLQPPMPDQPQADTPKPVPAKPVQKALPAKEPPKTIQAKSQRLDYIHTQLKAISEKEELTEEDKQHCHYLIAERQKIVE